MARSGLNPSSLFKALWITTKPEPACWSVFFARILLYNLLLFLLKDVMSWPRVCWYVAFWSGSLVYKLCSYSITVIILLIYSPR